MKEKIRKLTYWFVKNGGIKAMAALILIIVFVSIFKRNNDDVEIYDLKFLFSIVVLMLLEIVVSVLSKYVMNFFEDSIKLDKNYARVAKRYNKGELFLDGPWADAIKFPVAEVRLVLGYDLVINDHPKQMYTLPKDVKEHYSELFNAHETSNVFNQLVIRVEDWGIDKKKKSVIIDTSRSTYYNSLVTNRAMDYSLKDNLTIRDIYQFGPYIPSLKESPLSNHLGFNIIVVSLDGYVPFVKRANYVSIGKKEYGNSVGASLKAKYCLNNDGEFEQNSIGIVNAIYSEIKDELNLDLNLYSDKDQFFKKSLVATYRDMVEGGKPQLLFCVYVNKPREVIEKHFYLKNERNQSWDKEAKELKDGKHMDWVSLAEMRNAKFSLNGMRCNNKFFKMTPSATVSAMLVAEHYKPSKDANMWKVNPMPPKREDVIIC